MWKESIQHILFKHVDEGSRDSVKKAYFSLYKHSLFKGALASYKISEYDKTMPGNDTITYYSILLVQ